MSASDPIIVLSSTVRTLKHSYGDMLSHNGSYPIRRGSTINVGEPIERGYDHKAKIAVPIDHAGKDDSTPQEFVLWEELSKEDQDKLRVLYPGNELIARVH